MYCDCIQSYPLWEDTLSYEDDEGDWWMWDDELGTYDDSTEDEESDDDTFSDS